MPVSRSARTEPDGMRCLPRCDWQVFAPTRELGSEPRGTRSQGRESIGNVAPEIPGARACHGKSRSQVHWCKAVPRRWPCTNSRYLVASFRFQDQWAQLASSSRNAFVSHRRYAANTVSVIGACGPMRSIIHSAKLVFERYRIRALHHRPKFLLSIARPRRLISRVLAIVFLSKHSQARFTTPNLASCTLRIFLEATIAIREIAVD